MRKILIFLLLTLSVDVYAQLTLSTDSARQLYRDALNTINKGFAGYYYPNRAFIYSLNEKKFLHTIDSLKHLYELALKDYIIINEHDTAFIRKEKSGIVYFFDRIILDYPYFHQNHTGKKVALSPATQNRLNKHLGDFNNPGLLSNIDVKDYIEGFLRHQSSIEVKKAAYKMSDNKRLDAYLALIPRYFTNQDCKDFWQYHFISNHLENWGGKHTGKSVSRFLATCKNETYRKTIDSIYTESVNPRKGHVVETYKTVDGYQLDMHLFLPDSIHHASKRPVIVYFSGGSWTQGNPEWAFYSCADYASRGWVGVSVEYRLADRHETTPFEAVKDARSAIRWLRMHATQYNIDTNRIVVSGNSAGGHLVLTTALASDCNESTDDLRYSAIPNLLLVNAGVYDLYAEDATDWIMRDLADKQFAKKISPIHLLKKGTPPMLIIHGTNDRSVDYATAKAFVQEMERLGNEVEFHTLEGAPHHIWFDRRFSGRVAELRKHFLQKRGYLARVSPER
jgi:acetyl esterase/lipase